MVCTSSQQKAQEIYSNAVEILLWSYQFGRLATGVSISFCSFLMAARMNSESSLVAAFTSRLALKLTYLVRFDNLPEPGFLDTDRLFTAGIQVKY